MDAEALIRRLDDDFADLARPGATEDALADLLALVRAQELEPQAAPIVDAFTRRTARGVDRLGARVAFTLGAVRRELRRGGEGDAWRSVAELRSQVQAVRDLYPSWAASRGSAEADDIEDVDDALRDAEPWLFLERDDIPAGTPRSHWWWWGADGAPAPETTA